MINADDLVSLFRAEAARRQQVVTDSADGQARLILPPIRHLPEVRELVQAESMSQRNGRVPDLAENEKLQAVPRPTWWRTVDPKTQRLKELVRMARDWSSGSKKLPKFLRGLFRKQGRYNTTIAESVSTLTNANEQLSKQVRELTAAFQAQSAWLQTFAERYASDFAAGAQAQEAAGEWTAARVAAIHADLAALRNALGPLTADLQERANSLTDQLHRSQLASAQQNAGLQEVQWNFLNLAEDVTTIGVRINALNAQLTALAQRHDDTTAATNEWYRRETALMSTSLGRLEERLASEAMALRGQLSALRTAAIRARREASPSEDAGSATAAATPEFDAFYLAFEDQFRGATADIRTRLEVYLPFLASTGADEGGGVLDLGCGRGEWLQLLRGHNIPNATGVDLNISMIERCSGLELAVVHADAVAHLRSLPDASLAVITSFHLIEHLPFAVLMEFLHEILRVLRPGGCTILETPNPRNILVGASDFYRDMTHNRPLHPDTMRFTLETLGFADVSCYFLADDQHGRSAIPRRDYIFTDLQSYVDVPRDFAVIGRKA